MPQNKLFPLLKEMLDLPDHVSSLSIHMDVASRPSVTVKVTYQVINKDVISLISTEEIESISRNFKLVSVEE